MSARPDLYAADHQQKETVPAIFSMADTVPCSVEYSVKM